MLWVPTIEFILTIFKEHIKNAQLKDRDGLISTLDKVKWGIPTQGIPNIWERASILFRDIVEYHYFSDGNKRIGILLSYLFLEKNEQEFSPPKGEIFSMTMAVAQGLKSFDEIKEWFTKYSKKK